MSPTDRGRLHGLLRDELRARLRPAGWVEDPAYDTEPGSGDVGAFRYPLRDEFAATAQFRRTLSPRSQIDWFLEVSGEVGVSYLPAYRLWPVVGEYERAELEIDVGTLLGRSYRDGVAAMRGPDDVPAAADALAGPVLGAAVPWAERHASVDAILEETRAHPPSLHWELQLVPVMLAASGRHREARAALAGYLALGGEEVDTRQIRGFSYQLRRWLDEGGVLPDPPDRPVGSRHHDLDRKLEVNLLTVAGAALKEYPRIHGESRRRREALDAVRREQAGKDRDQLRELLTAELERRSVTMPRAAMELALDELTNCETPLDRALFRARLGTVAVKSLFDVGSSIAKVFKGDTSGIQVAPEPRWLDPPARASYRVETLRTEKAETAGTEWAEVDVDPDASSWLDRVVEASSRVFRGMSLEISTVDAWLDTDGEAPDRRRIVVHIGAQRVGTVEGSRAAPYREAMAAAAARHELPYLRARLQRRPQPPRHLLEIAFPSNDEVP